MGDNISDVRSYLPDYTALRPRIFIDVHKDNNFFKVCPTKKENSEARKGHLPNQCSVM